MNTEMIGGGHVEVNSFWNFGQLSTPRSEVVLPYLHRLDEGSMQNGTRMYFSNKMAIEKRIWKICEGLGFAEQKIKQIAEIMYQSYGEGNIPSSLVNDLFNFYYHDIKSLDFEEKQDFNEVIFKLIERLNQPTLKVLCQGHPLKTMLLVRTLLSNFLFAYALRKVEDPPDSDPLMDQLKMVGSGSAGMSNSDTNSTGGSPEPGPGSMDGPPLPQQQGNNSAGFGNSAGKGVSSPNPAVDPLDRQLDEMMNAPSAKKFSDQAIKEIKKMISSLDEAAKPAELDDAWKDLGMNNGNDSTIIDYLDPDKLKQVHRKLKEIRLNISGVRSMLKRLLDNSLNYFSSKVEKRQIPFLEAETMEGIRHFELLHPRVRNYFLDEITVEKKKRVGKIDVYVDISGSMNLISGMKDEKGNDIKKRKLAKALLVELRDIDMLADLYLFNDYVNKRGTTLPDILSIPCDGGTNIDAIFEQVKNTQKNSLIITDGEDRCTIYHQNVFFLGIAGARFESFREDVLRSYVDNGQIIYFDGQQIYQIDYEGRPIC